MDSLKFLNSFFPPINTQNIDFNIEFPDDIDEEQKGYLMDILKQEKKPESGKSEELVEGYYFMNSQDVVKEIIDEVNLSSTGL